MIGGDLIFLGRHTDMSFIYQQIFVTFEILIAPLIIIFPDLGAPALALPVLDGSSGIGRKMLCESIAILDDGHDLAAFMQCIARKEDFPVAVIDPLQRSIQPVPVIEIAG